MLYLMKDANDGRFSEDREMAMIVIYDVCSVYAVYTVSTLYI